MNELKLGKLQVENITQLPAYERMERAGRVCYRSEHMMKEGSAKKFLRMIRDNKHYSVLGHSQLLASLAMEDAVDIDLFCPQHLQHQFTFVQDGDRMLVGAGFDSWLQLFEYVSVPIAVYFKQQFPDIFGNITVTEPDDWNNEVRFQTSETLSVSMAQAPYLFKETYVLTVDRATAMQLRTYRFATHSVESQRYVNYMKNGFTYIMPPELETADSAVKKYWEETKQNEMRAYAFFIAAGYKPEFARTALGQDIQTQMVITASLWEWRHIFNCRLNSHTQSNARTIVQLVKNDLLAKYEQTPFYEWLQE